MSGPVVPEASNTTGVAPASTENVGTKLGHGKAEQVGKKRLAPRAIRWPITS